jgi:hypothetical protein
MYDIQMCPVHYNSELSWRDVSNICVFPIHVSLYCKYDGEFGLSVKFLDLGCTK